MSARVVFMGTPDFAVPTLHALVAQGWDVLVVTQPDKKVGRKQVLTPPPVKQQALEMGLQVLQPTKVRDSEIVERLEAFEPQLLVTAAYGQLLPNRILEIPRVGAVNVHASLLPRWRGAAPIHRAIMAGDATTGVTLMEMVLALDAGPIIDMREIAIDERDNTGRLHDKLAALGAEMCTDLLPRYLAGELIATPQPDEGVTYAARIERADEFIDWCAPAEQVSRTIRGLSPWPCASAVIVDGHAVKIWHGKRAESSPRVDIGAAVKIGHAIFVGCADGAIELEEVQPAGKRKMPALDWFSGMRVDTVQFQKGGME